MNKEVVADTSNGKVSPGDYFCHVNYAEYIGNERKYTVDTSLVFVFGIRSGICMFVVTSEVG